MIQPGRGAVAIVGVGLWGLPMAKGWSAMEIQTRAVNVALSDAGLSLHDVDGLFTSSSHYFTPTLSTAEYLGIRPRISDGTMVGGASFVRHLIAAALALEARLCNVALICYGSNQASELGKLRSMSEPQKYEAPYNPRPLISSYALAAARHMHEFGTTRSDLAEVAVAARKWAQPNPEAYARSDLSIDQVLASRMISDPLSLLDCCLVTDGGGAIVLVRRERAEDGPQSPVYLLGAAEAQWHRQISCMSDLTLTAASESGPRAFASAGLGPADVDVAELYDAFTINTILFLEDLGFCKKGEGGAFVRDGAIAPGGRLAVNTNGGGLSCCHPGMYGIFLVVEGVRQLRRQAPGYQVSDANVALCHANGGTLSSQVTALLGTRATL